MWTVIFLFIFHAEANTFVFEQRPYKSSVMINNNMLKFSSVRLTKNIQLNACTQPLARALNTKIFSSITGRKELDGIPVNVDGKKLFLKKTINPTKFFTDVDYRVMAIDMKSRASCPKI